MKPVEFEFNEHVHVTLFYRPEVNLKDPWALVEFKGSSLITFSPDLTPETPARLRALADEIDLVYAEKARIEAIKGFVGIA